MYSYLISGAHGVGRIDIVENRFVGMKSRGKLFSLTCLQNSHYYFVCVWVFFLSKKTVSLIVSH